MAKQPSQPASRQTLQKSNKEQLEEWLLDPVEIVIDSSVPCRIDRSFLIPRAAGVYLLHDLRGVLYVGRSEDLQRRFDEHFWQRRNQRIAAVLAKPVGELKFSWHTVGFPEQVAVERGLIRYFRPVCNYQLY